MGPTSTAAVAAVLSGAPSTVLAVARGDDPLSSTRAVGSIVVGDEASPTRQLVIGGVAHAFVASGWTVALWRLLPRRHPLLAGAAGGLAIAALDLGVIGRRLPAIRRLPLAPLLADHLAFGVVVAWCRFRAGRQPE